MPWKFISDEMKKKVVTVLGTRPEIIKLALLIGLLDRKFDHKLIYTSQHYSYNMARVFFEQLGVREPDGVLEVKSSDTGTLQKAIENSIQELNAELVVVYGDTNSTVAAARAAKALGKKLAHVEAGLRCFDETVPEEKNRIETDLLSDFLFPPTELAKTHLIREGVGGKIWVVGNTVVDVCKKYSSKIKEREGRYILVTAHRQENADKPERLMEIFSALSQFQIEVLFPVHPRTKERIGKFGIDVPKNVKIMDAVRYFEFLGLLKGAELVVTDSGGVQEEALTLNTPCLTIRQSTERWESIAAGGNFLVGTNPALIKAYAKEIIDGELGKSMRKAKNPYGNGQASEKIAETLEHELAEEP